MELKEALENLKNPNDKFDLDLIAIRTVLLDLVGQQRGLINENPREVVTDPEPFTKKRKKI
jgi:hypothetical protein